MRILMVNWLYPPEYSGAGLQCHRLSQGLRSRGIQVDVLTGTDRQALVGPGRVDGMNVYRVLRDKSNPLRHLRFGGELTAYILKNIDRYDLLHAHGFIVPASLAARLTRRPLVQKITNLNIDDPEAVRRRRCSGIFLSMYQAADVLIATSGRLESCCRLGLPRRMRILRIPNGVDTVLFRPALDAEKSKLRAELEVRQGETVLMILGPICFKKGLDVLIRALQMLDRSVLLWVIGPEKAHARADDAGSYHRLIRKMVAELGLARQVRFFGFQPQVHHYLRAADIYVHPSRGEGQPNSILEAMSCGLPTVANLLPGITDEIIQNGKFGYLVEGNEPQVLAAALRILINNPELRIRLGSSARAEILQKHAIANIARRYCQLYRELLGREREKVKSTDANEGASRRHWRAESISRRREP